VKCTATCAYGFSATKLCTSSLHLILYGFTIQSAACWGNAALRWSQRLPK